MTKENRIVKVELSLLDNNYWQVAVTKEFAPEDGGGSYVFTDITTTRIHRALEIARGMVTLHHAVNPGHVHVVTGYCPVCKHYGADCTGAQEDD